MRAYAVIGSNFGDEGKGLFTDRVSSEYGPNCIVVRHNGGAQAGHTVVTPDGVRHVFSHISSGTFTGAPTYLSEYFVVNPMIFFREYSELSTKCKIPTVLVDKQALVTTPYDMLINEILEDSRGNNRHGSVGLGFGETIERSQHPNYTLTVGDLHDKKIVKQKLWAIQNIWVPTRLQTLGIFQNTNPKQGYLKSQQIFDNWIQQCLDFVDLVRIVSLEILKEYEFIVFEGAQGLLLDQNFRFFPHVTRSNTGIENASILAHKLGLEEMEVTYATRTYLTRHGAGPLFGELPEKPYPGIIDTTNVNHPYQGHLRYAYANLDLFTEAVSSDLKKNNGLRIKPILGVSCLDQVPSTISWIRNGEIQTSLVDDMIYAFSRTINAHEVWKSRGPTRTTIVFESI